MSAAGNKRARKKPEAPDAVAAPAPPGLWPEEFAPLKKSLAAAFCVAGWGVILAMLATDNSLLGLKQALAIIAGARLEPVLLVESLHSLDIAAVLFAFIVLVGAAYIHVALGLAFLLAVRPWLDGFVYAADNAYFLWAAMLLLAVWAVRQWSRPRPIRGETPLALFAFFVLWCAVTSPWAIQPGSTYRELINWVYYGAILFLTLNATDSATARGIVLTGFFVGMAGQALYAYPYLYYLLPWMRQYMAEDPRRLASFFDGLTEFTPEVARRFNMNRASASMVYPNALAALLLLGLPACLALAVDAWRRARAPIDPASLPPLVYFRYLAPWAAALFAVPCLVLFLLGQMALVYQHEGSPWFGSPFNLTLLSVAVAALISGAFLFGARRWGLERAGQWLGALVATFLFPLMLGALWITYSRGAMLALILAVALAAPLAGSRPATFLRHFGRRFGRAALFAASLALVLATLLAAGAQDAGPAPSAAPQATPSRTVTGEGIDVGLTDLANPSSFRLRLGYWRVACGMGLDHGLIGVGLNNFKYAYPAYQYLGAGDVQNPHNALLQVWCESGIPGAVLFLLFWCYLLWRGVEKVRGVAPPGRGLLALGLLTGILAFLLHALLDVSFSHPTLVTFAMAATGLLLANGTPAGDAQGTGAADPRLRRAGAVALLLLAALFSGIAARPYLLELGMNGGKFLHVGDTALVDRRIGAARYFLVECTTWAVNGKQGEAPVRPVRDVLSLIAKPEQLFHLGRLLAIDEQGRAVEIPTGAFAPPDALFQIARPWDAAFAVFDTTEAWLQELERLDRRFPYDPEKALALCTGYKLLAEQAGPRRAERLPGLLVQMLYWAEEAVRRSPWRADVHQMLAWVHWTAGTYTKGDESLSHFRRALDAFARCVQQNPHDPSARFAHAQALKALGQSYQNAGVDNEARRLLDQARVQEEEGTRIRQQRWDLGLP